MDSNEFIRNSSAIPLEVIERYENKHVAWSEDGKEIIASADTLAELFAVMNQRGLTKYVVGFIPPIDEVWLGGSFVE